MTSSNQDFADSESDAVEQKKAADKAREEELELHRRLNLTPSMLSVIEPDGRPTWVNDFALQYFGLSAADITSDHFVTRVVHPDDLQRVREERQRALASGVPFKSEQRMRRHDGQYRWVLVHYRPLKDAAGRVVRWYGGAIDIEDRKRAEDKIREQEAELRQILDLTPHLLFVFGPDGVPVHANRAALEYFGVNVDQLLGESRINFVHPDDRARFLGEREKGLLQGLPHEFEGRLLRYDGSFRWFLFRRNPFKDEEGQVTRWYGGAIDIEDRKRAEEALQRSEGYLAEAQRLSHTGSWALDATGFQYWSLELFRIHGLDPSSNAPRIDEYLRLVHPDDRQFIERAIQNMLADHRAFDYTKRIVRPDGNIRYVRCVGNPVNQGGTFRGFVGSAVDVTEQELLAQELRRREAYLTEAQRLSHTGSFGWRPDSGELVWSDETYCIFDYDHAVKPTIDLVVQRVHPEDRADFLKVIEGASAGATQFEHTYRLLLPDGSVKHVHALAHALQDASGNREFVGAVTDVTSIKRAEEKLRKSEAYLAEAQRLSQTGSWAWSPDQDLPLGQSKHADIRYWSEECYRVLSFDPRDGLPRFEDFFQRLHPDDQPGFRELVQTAIREKAEWEADYRIMHPDGPVRDIHVVGHPVLSTSGHLVEFVGTVIDVTERKRAEEASRQHETEIRALNEQLIKAQEAERMRIAGELHDGVLQQITSLVLRMGMIRRQVPPDSEAKTTANALQQELIQIGTEIRHISHELHPSLLREAGLPTALSSYCEEFSHVRGLPVSCEADESVKELSPEAALCLYRIAQEALGNAAKYSQAKKAEVRLTRPGDRVCLFVSDDGIGCDPSQITKSGGLGVINMRERVLQLKGTFEFDSEPGRGTRVTVTVPFRAAS